MAFRICFRHCQLTGNPNKQIAQAIQRRIELDMNTVREHETQTAQTHFN